MSNKKINMSEFVPFLKDRGFVFQGSEIYGGLSNTWDYGPLGSLLKENIKNSWLKKFILSEINNQLIDSKILLNPKVWEASGHIASFSDPLIENKVNGKRYRADKLIEDHDSSIDAEALSHEEMYEYISKNILEHEGSKTNWTNIRKFNLMFETSQGVIQDNKSKVYLRPETAQGIFINFKNVQRSQRLKVPFGIGQVGKSFRNEVTPGNFIFRTREFEQMELEFFVHYNDADEFFKYYLSKAKDFISELGINEENIKFYEHPKEKLSHYSKATTDIEYKFPFGWSELLGVANRGDFDLKVHSELSGNDLTYLDPFTNEKYFPYVIEPSIGLDRLMLAILLDAYTEEELENETRTVLKLNKKIAPYKFAVLPLTKKLSEKALEIFTLLSEEGIVGTFDEVGSIGKRYRRQDANGTPFSVTIDYDTLEDNMVTIRDRDTMEQQRVEINKLKDILK
ncbi:MAG: glycine--tRNA ligase [Mycoplasma sp.]|nr:glycine--tRNA ligase [Mycoplasma sp.]